MVRQRSCAVTQRDSEILSTLTCRVRFLSIRQVAGQWWSHCQHSCRLAARRMTQLESAGLVERFSIVAHPEIVLAKPLATWSLGKPPPHFGQISYRLRKRWDQPAIITPVVMPTQAAVRIVGGRVIHRPRPVEATHDLHLATVYLAYFQKYANLASTWIPEDVVAQRQPKANVELPDAMIWRAGRPVVVELGGAYRPARLAEIHHYCHAQNYSYEIW